ncbi:FadR/GntR family transcriptional regulator [Parasporobacterium paucivorans]|uniref:GntR family transcriptional regulator, transcriptional repressor for pyruvate dehydrogenase complex n=1 Tax=Parasporobacterium paucivorans DSM 15970 TaxID=1122934 RepID=A0A1M6IGI9_9FIRM|nr:FadR/GntR family transcriptional regulator [Parasporobacterium paucivorans]SHJ33585.1 GntR family transcriptional regulator, transcriptional repressor for pyruvate dehydrogenase complex [Parasporobacterium paucivorans DSM 15970]
MFKHVKEKKLYEQVVDQVKYLIDKGELKIGDPLPSVDELAQMVGVGRSTVREALVVLEAIGCIRTARGKVAVITGTTQQVETPLDPLDMLENYKNRFQLVQEYNMILEPAVASLAAKKATDEDIERLGRNIEQMKEALKKRNSQNTVEQLSMEFHLILMEIVRNPYILNIFNLTKQIEKDNRKVVLKVDNRIDDTVSEHYEIYLAIKDHDEEKAFKAMMKHVQNVGLAFEAL